MCRLWTLSTVNSSESHLVLLRLSSLRNLRFLSRYFRSIVSYLYHDISCTCGITYLLGTFAMQARSIRHQSTQVSACFVTCHRLLRMTFSVWLRDPGWAASPRKTATTAFGCVIFRMSQLPAFMCVVAFSLVYFVWFECNIRRALAYEGLNILSINKTKERYGN